MAAAKEAVLPIAIGVQLGEQRVFHTALPGSSSTTTTGWRGRRGLRNPRYGQASLAVGESFRDRGASFDTDSRLDPSVYAAHGGVVPLRLKSGTVIGVVGVSGLPQLEDHAFVVEHLRAYLALAAG